jgi:hypothetical protein
MHFLAAFDEGTSESPGRGSLLPSPTLLSSPAILEHLLHESLSLLFGHRASSLGRQTPGDSRPDFFGHGI